MGPSWGGHTGQGRPARVALGSWTAAFWGPLCRRSPPAGAGIAWRLASPPRSSASFMGFGAGVSLLRGRLRTHRRGHRGRRTRRGRGGPAHRRARLPRGRAVANAGAYRRKPLCTAAPTSPCTASSTSAKRPRRGPRHPAGPHHRPQGRPPAAGALVIGALLDGIPDRPPSASACSTARVSAWPSSPPSSSPTSRRGMAPARARRQVIGEEHPPLCGWPSLSSRRSLPDSGMPCSGYPDPLSWVGSRFRCRSLSSRCPRRRCSRGCRSRGPLVWARHRAGVRGSRPPRRALTRSLPRESGPPVRNGTSVANRSTWSRPAPGHPQ